MPADSRKQQQMIYAKRGQYKSKENTPEDWKWIWNDDWSKVKEEKDKLYIIPGTDAVRLKDRNYHVHTSDLIEGMEPLEIETFKKICNELEIKEKELSIKQRFMCYEHIFNTIQITYNALLENKENQLRERYKKHFIRETK
jgi:hypothetical protein